MYWLPGLQTTGTDNVLSRPDLRSAEGGLSAIAVAVGHGSGEGSREEPAGILRGDPRDFLWRDAFQAGDSSTRNGDVHRLVPGGGIRTQDGRVGLEKQAFQREGANQLLLLC